MSVIFVRRSLFTQSDEAYESFSAACSVRQRHRHKDMRLIAEHTGSVTLAGGIIGEHDIAGLEDPFRVVAGFNFPRP
jgi:hypothetical protein